jgi:transposase
MSRKVLTVKGYSSESIKALFNQADKYKIGIRLYAVYQVSKGVCSRKLAEFYNTSFKQITTWVHNFEREGLEGLKNKPRSGRPSKLTQQQLNFIKELVLKHSPTSYQYNTETWTGCLLLDWIKKNYGVEYKKTQIYCLLKKLGLSYQKTKGYFPETDVQKQEAFKEILKKSS